MDVQGSAALVTGGASGLGRATARELHARGAAVLLVDLDETNGRRTAAEIGGAAEFIRADVRSERDVAAAVAKASDMGPLRTVVNCAGIGDPARAISRSGPIALERFQRVIDINLVGSFNVIRLAAAQMAELEPVGGERGVVINTASVAAFDGQIGQASYAASKGAIVAMTLPLAREFATHQIRVMAIAPGMFDTPILQGLSEDARASLAAQIPHPSRLGDPAEYARLAAHIVDNPMLNGEVIRLDGAIRMAPR